MAGAASPARLSVLPYVTNTYIISAKHTHTHEHAHNTHAWQIIVPKV